MLGSRPFLSRRMKMPEIIPGNSQIFQQTLVLQMFCSITFHALFSLLQFPGKPNYLFIGGDRGKKLKKKIQLKILFSLWCFHFKAQFDFVFVDMK